MAATDTQATGGTDQAEHPPDALIEATTALLSAVTAITLPLALPTAEPARRARMEIEHILQTAILPRLRTPDAPLLCALAGPTGVGKSTLLNALAGATLSATGPLRPTTRAAVLVCHPADLAGGEVPVEASVPGAGEAATGTGTTAAAAAAAGNSVGDDDSVPSEVPVSAGEATSGEASEHTDTAVSAETPAAGDLESGKEPAAAAEAASPDSETEPSTAASSESVLAKAATVVEASTRAEDPATAAEPQSVAEQTGAAPERAESGTQSATGPAELEAARVGSATTQYEPETGQPGSAAEQDEPAERRAGSARAGDAAGLGARVGAELASLLSSPLPSPSLPRGVALVDTVDGDVAVVGAADVVVVVVSAERYADAAVWRVLRRVGGLGVPVVVVLGRVAAEVVEEVSGAFVELLRVNGLGAVPFFVVEEVGGSGAGSALVDGDAQGAELSQGPGQSDGDSASQSEDAAHSDRAGRNENAAQGDSASQSEGIAQGSNARRSEDDAHGDRASQSEDAADGRDATQGDSAEQSVDAAQGSEAAHGDSAGQIEESGQGDTAGQSTGVAPGVEAAQGESSGPAEGRGEEADGEGAPARGAFPGDSGALCMDGGQGEGTAGVESGAPGEGGYGDGGLGCAGEPAGGTGIGAGSRAGTGIESGTRLGVESGAGDGGLGSVSDSVSASVSASVSGALSASVSAPASASASTSATASGAGIGDGPPLLQEAAVAGLFGWLRDAGADTAGRVRIGMLGVAGRLDSVDRLVQELADAWEGQRLALQVLHQGLERVHTAERVRFRGAVDAGELLGGEVRIRWQELLGSGRVSALFGAEDGGRKSRRRKRAEADWAARFHNPTAHDAATAPLRAALVEAVARGYRGALERAARKTSDQWELTPGAPEIDIADGAAPRAGDPARAAAEWLDHLPAVILDQAHSRRTTRTIGPTGAHIRSAALVLGVAALAGGGAAGAEATSAPPDDPAASAALTLLHTMFGPEAADRLLTTATTTLKAGNARLLDRAAEAHRAQLAAHALDPRHAQALAEARAAVARARNEEV